MEMYNLWTEASKRWIVQSHGMDTFYSQVYVCWCGSAQIHYSAFAALSPQPDPRQPVALSQARGVPGLMTVLERQLIRERTEPVAVVQSSGDSDPSSGFTTIAAQDVQ